MRKFIFAVIGALATSSVMAQEGSSISSERPSYSSSPFTLAPGYWQVELGYQFADEGGTADVSVHTLPLALIRVGLTERLEVQLNWPGYNEVNTNAGDIDGRSDAMIGLKWQLSDNNARTPVGLFAGITLPIGSDVFSSDDEDPVIGVFWSHAGIADFFGTVDASFGENSDVFHNAVGVNLPISDTIGSFVEVVSAFPENGGPQHSLGGGISFLYNRDLQFDLNAGFGLNSRATNFIFGVGVARRF